MADTTQIKEPTLLVKIINKIDSLTEQEQKKLWMQLNKEELLQEAGLLDKAIVPSKLSENEIVELVRSSRQ